MTAPEPTEPELYWSRNQNAVYRVYIDAGIFILGDRYRHFGDDLPRDAVRLAPAAGVEALLRRCDELAAAWPGERQAITVDEVRALLGVPAPTKENRDAH